MLPEDATADEARQPALMTYVLNAGTGYDDPNATEDFAETPYSADEVQRIIDRQAANAWSYEQVPGFTESGGRFATTPNGMLMGLGGDWVQQTLSQQGGSTYGDIYAANVDNPKDPAQQLGELIQSGHTWYDDANGVPHQHQLDLDRLLHHEERHSQQWAEMGPIEFAKAYGVGLGYDQLPGHDHPFETNAGLGDGGYQ